MQSSGRCRSAEERSGQKGRSSREAAPVFAGRYGQSPISTGFRRMSSQPPKAIRESAATGLLGGDREKFLHPCPATPQDRPTIVPRCGEHDRELATTFATSAREKSRTTAPP